MAHRPLNTVQITHKAIKLHLTDALFLQYKALSSGGSPRPPDFPLKSTLYSPSRFKPEAEISLLGRNWDVIGTKVFKNSLKTTLVPTDSRLKFPLFFREKKLREI